MLLNTLCDRLTTSARYRLEIAVRVLAATLGSYALASGFVLALTDWMPLDERERLLTGMLLGLLVHVGGFLWVFAVRSPAHACAGMALGCSACFAAVGWKAVIG